jgi:hypothetical protein
MKNMTVERGAKLYKKGIIKPWKVDLLRGPDENYICIASPYDEKKILIMREWAESTYENMLEIMKEAVEPDDVKMWWGDLS